MKKSSFELLKILALSTSWRNRLKYCKDSKKKNRIIGEITAYVLLGGLLLAYCAAIGIFYGQSGFGEYLPAVSALIVSIFTFIFTLIKTNGYLFKFKEYDTLMSLPFEAREVAGCKFLYMYMKSALMDVGISVAMLLGYGIYVRPAFWVYPVWIVLALFVPIIPMLIAAFLGFLVAAVSSGFKKKNAVQIVFTFVLVLLVFVFRYGIEYVMKNDSTDEIITSLSDYIGKIGRFYFPMKWFEDAIVRGKISGILLLIGVSIALFEVIFLIVGKSYREINSKLKSHSASKKFKLKEQKVKSILNTIAFKEFKRMTGSVIYFVNSAMGEVIVLIASIAVCFVNLKGVLGEMFGGDPADLERYYPLVPIIIYLMVGMVATTVMSPSLEGKNFWIMQSLPITKKDIYKGKMLFNLYLTVPAMAIGTICVSISAGLQPLYILLSLILGFILLLFSTAWGCVCGIKHINLEWENEIEVVKQGTALMIYMLPNMFGTMLLIGLEVALANVLNPYLILLALIAVAAALATLCYRRVLALAK